jgi:GT2 family glycosyltransferase
MPRQDAPETLEAANEALRQVQAELRASQRQLKRVLELVEKHQAQLNAHESSIARLDRILMEILTGRVWRTLRAAGDLAKRFAPRGGAGNSADSVVLNSRQRSFLVCDEPKPSDLALRSGTITVKGWCVAERGVDGVQIDVPGIPRIQVVPSIPRPDVKKHHPDLDTTGRAGFAADFDSLTLPNGRHVITLRLISQGKPIRETRSAVQIHHEHGFSSDYYRWIHDFEEPDDDLIALKLLSFSYRPTFSILMPVYNTNPSELTAAIESVIAQSYSNWQLCIADDSSSRAETRAVLERYADHPKIKISYQTERGGISRATNAARQLASGDYLCLLDHDDTLSHHALAWICETLDRYPETDLLYSDEDKIDTKGKRFDPFFKPDWSPDLLLSENYVCHLLVLRQDLAQKIGHLNPDCDGSQDYDLILRATEQAREIRHIPRVLYHWRASEGSTAVTLENKNYALDAAQRALAARSGDARTIELGRVTGRWRARYPIPQGTRVSIIIPSGGKLDVLRTNLTTLFAKTEYRDYEVVVIDNSKHNAIEGYLRELASEHVNSRYIDWRNKPFNFSAICNAAAKTCDSPVLLFLNDDTSVIEPGWLDALLELAVRPEVGAVGAKLLYPDGRIQHAGVVMGLYDNCGHAFKGLDGSTSHYFDFPDVIRNVSAVTGACLMTRTDVFWKVGGFDETEFAVAFNDIDLCLKIGNAGYRVLYTPHALLYHHEAFSKTSKDLVPHPQEVEAMRLKWEAIIDADPYYNPNLTRNDEDYSLKTRA